MYSTTKETKKKINPMMIPPKAEPILDPQELRVVSVNVSGIKKALSYIMLVSYQFQL